MSFPGLFPRNSPDQQILVPRSQPRILGPGGHRQGPFLSGLSRSAPHSSSSLAPAAGARAGGPQAETGPKAGPAAPKLQLGLCNCPQALAGPPRIRGFLPLLREKG